MYKKSAAIIVSTFLCALVSTAQRPMGTVRIWNPDEGGAASGTVKVRGLNSTMIGAVDRQDGFASNLTVYGSLTLNGDSITNWYGVRVGQIGYNGSLSFASSNTFLPFGSTSLVSVTSLGITGTPSTGTFTIPKSGWYKLNLSASWEAAGADVYYGAFSSNGTALTYGQAADETKNANDDGHLATFYSGFFTNGTQVGVLVKSDNAQGGTLLDYLFGILELK
jgi:hypothetical protein